MVSIKFGNGITAMVGSAGGNTWAKNAYGWYMKQKPIPTGAPSPAKLAVQARMFQISQAWVQLPSGLRNAWENYSAQNPVLNRLGDSVVLSGIAMFNKVNGILLLIGDSIRDTPPPNDETEVITYEGFSFSTPISPPGELTVTVGFSPSTISVNTKLVMRITPTISKSKTNVESLYRVAGVSTTAQASTWGVVVSSAISTYQVGDRVAGRVQAVDIRTGRLSVAFDAIGEVSGT